MYLILDPFLVAPVALSLSLSLSLCPPPPPPTPSHIPTLKPTSHTQHTHIYIKRWVIDILALRVGGEKGEDEADTVGCCSLRVEHVKFKQPGQGVHCYSLLLLLLPLSFTSFFNLRICAHLVCL
jgi:hypothetical protein